MPRLAAYAPKSGEIRGDVSKMRIVRRIRTPCIPPDLQNAPDCEVHLGLIRGPEIALSAPPDLLRLLCPGPTAPVADAAPAVYEHVFFFMAVAFNDGSVGGAAKANRWAARIP